ncbi:MAG TPA: hypothetical protein VGC80_18595 [Acetobacteraceae bacterium]
MRILAPLALSAALLTGACTDPYGRYDPGATAGLAVGLAALGGAAYLASRHDDGPHYRHHDHDRGWDGGWGRHRGW